MNQTKLTIKASSILEEFKSVLFQGFIKIFKVIKDIYEISSNTQSH